MGKILVIAGVLLALGVLGAAFHGYLGVPWWLPLFALGGGSMLALAELRAEGRR